MASGSRQIAVKSVYETSKRVHLDRTAGGHRYHRDSRGAAAADARRGQAKGPSDWLPEQPSAVELGVQNVCG